MASNASPSAGVDRVTSVVLLLAVTHNLLRCLALTA